MADAQPDASGHRARQRLFDDGGGALLDHELAEYLLALAIPRRDTKGQARALIARFGGIGGLLSADVETLRREGLTNGYVSGKPLAHLAAGVIKGAAAHLGEKIDIRHRPVADGAESHVRFEICRLA